MAPAVPVRTGSEQLLADFARYLTEDRGCVASTVQAYQRFARAFVTEVTGRGACRPGRWWMAQVVAFVCDHLRGHGRTPNAHALTTALRCFLRFVQDRRVDLKVDLAAAVPRLPVWALASLPAPLPAGGMAKLLAHCDRTTALGQRDYALLVLMTNLGLRSSEVCRLRLDDLDWTGGSLRLRAAFARAGIIGLRQGAHTLRHTAAMEMLQAGVDRALIALWLGHESVETTQIYLHADLTMKEQILQRTQPTNAKLRRFQPTDRLLRFLRDL